MHIHTYLEVYACQLLPQCLLIPPHCLLLLLLLLLLLRAAAARLQLKQAY